MTRWLNRCHFGDVRQVLRSMIDDGLKVDTIITSPPYWGLRDYGHDGQLGLEPTFAEFLATMVEVFELARQVLKDDGTAWVNMGDSYAGKRQPGTGDIDSRRRDDHPVPRSDVIVEGLKPKDLIGQPWRLALALQDGSCKCTSCSTVLPASQWPVHHGQRVCVACALAFRLDYQVVPHAAGWWLRSDIIWHKPNPMPESCRDRPTKAHEYLFLLAKSERYAFDFEAWQESTSEATRPRRANNGVGFGHGTDADQRGRGRIAKPSGWNAGATGRAHDELVGRYASTPQHAPDRKLAEHGTGVKANKSMDAALATMPAVRNRRTVWTIPTEAFHGAHFATYPQKLVEPCILAGCPPGGTVLDIFFGSGTTGQVAQRMGRNWVGIELNPANEELQRERIGPQHGLPL